MLHILDLSVIVNYICDSHIDSGLYTSLNASTCQGLIIFPHYDSSTI